jgi:hypothetical protein
MVAPAQLQIRRAAGETTPVLCIHRLVVPVPLQVQLYPFGPVAEVVFDPVGKRVLETRLPFAERQGRGEAGNKNKLCPWIRIIEFENLARDWNAGS